MKIHKIFVDFSRSFEGIQKFSPAPKSLGGLELAFLRCIPFEFLSFLYQQNSSSRQFGRREKNEEFEVTPIYK